MNILRIIAIVSALSLMIGEAYRSWGVDRPVAFWMDDMLVGALMITAAILLRRETVPRRALFTGAWGVAMGMLYGSFFGKVFDPANSNSGNFDLGLLTVLIGAAFAVSVAGFIASIAIPFKPTN